MESGKPLATTAAFAAVGGWIAKLRVTGPANRTEVVAATLDALFAALEVERPQALHETRPLVLDAPCPAASTRDAAVLPAKIGLETLMGGAVTMDVSDASATSAFPDEGVTHGCDRGTLSIGDGSYDIIQRSSIAEPAIHFATLSDSGTILVVERQCSIVARRSASTGSARSIRSA